MFASTFTERLSAAPHLFDAIAAEIARGDRYWLLTLHPKCPPQLFERYRALAGPNAAFFETEQLVAAQRAADVLLADTTSVVSEFVVQRKPVVTFRNRAPKPHMLDFDDPAKLPAMLAARIRAVAGAAGRDRRLRRRRSIPIATGDLRSACWRRPKRCFRGELGRLRRKPLSSTVPCAADPARAGVLGLGQLSPGSL